MRLISLVSSKPTFPSLPPQERFEHEDLDTSLLTTALGVDSSAGTTGAAHFRTQTHLKLARAFRPSHPSLSLYGWEHEGPESGSCPRPYSLWPVGGGPCVGQANSGQGRVRFQGRGAEGGGRRPRVSPSSEHFGGKPAFKGCCPSPTRRCSCAHLCHPLAAFVGAGGACHCL